VVLHSPDHHASFLSVGAAGTARVVEMWSARTAALGSRADVGYVFVFENQGRATGATIDHPHSQVMAFATIPPVAMAELANGYCDLCKDPGGPMTVIGDQAWVAHVPWAPSWPYEMLICPRGHIPDLPSAGPAARAELAAILVECLTRVDRVLGPGAPYMLWLHQRPSGPGEWPAAHLHLHLAPVLRAPGVVRHLASAEHGAGVFFDPVDPREAAAQLRNASG
jgi:UDPglucose--hexose-1-phosphate uridylyltransferase